MKWIQKTFGRQRHGDRMEFVEVISEKTNAAAGIKYLIMEINLVFQRVDYEPGEVAVEKIAKWKAEIDGISEHGIVKFFTGDMKNLNLDQNELKGGRSFLLQVNIFHKEKIGVTLVTAGGR